MMIAMHEQGLTAACNYGWTLRFLDFRRGTAPYSYNYLSVDHCCCKPTISALDPIE